MKKSLILVCGLSLLLMSEVKQGYAMTDAEIDKRLGQIQALEAKAAKEQQDSEKMKKEVANRKAQEANNLQELRTQIEAQGAKLNEILKNIQATEDNVKKTNNELQEAEHRVETRDQLLKSRVRLMYTNGFVSYMEVLFESTSFSDFLDRYQALRSIVSQDKEILQSNKRDREAVAQKKIQVEAQLAQIQVQYAESEQIKNALVTKEKDKEVLIASLAKQEEQFEELSEEQEAALKKLAAEKSKLWAEKNKNKQAAMYTGGKFNWPLPGRTTISSGFIHRINPVTKRSENHKGIDIPAPAGTEIHAAAPGTVIIAQWVSGYGNTIVIDHGGGLQTWYGHARGLAAKEGDQVKAGDVVSYVGSTGQSTGNHLHFEVRKNGDPVDPIPYVTK
ncbi:murein hydrolase activator EnvC family protein [Paenibacillus mesophilus]|uniref:murein hydrolase activator EnvC family protein n=1 Tax=Paenibacillus mesophilus TaxID=2582849 RepID=UPI001EE3B629|nr:M23 family metallopeptidase [Paenibacillus mesophilus]